MHVSFSSCSFKLLHLLAKIGSSTGSEEDDLLEAEDGEGAFQLGSLPGGQQPVIRPGIVHRLDKGTTGTKGT